MDVLHQNCAGLDVHKKTVVACHLRPGPKGSVLKETRTFGTMTKDLEALADWLAAGGCTHVAMEATGVYWKPIYNVLEGRFSLLVVNAHHLKAVPGRKTDVKDAEWLAELLRHGLVRGSFVPERWQRELRELTRYRTALIRERAREINRLQKTLEAANLKLAAVLTDIAGVSGQRILDALLAGESDPEVLADLAYTTVQKKRPQLEQSLMGRLEGTLRFVVGQQLAHLRTLDQQIAQCDLEVERVTLPFAADLRRLLSIPGVGVRTVQTIVAEAGVDMRRFPTDKHFAAWAGMCPGNRASGGKRLATRTRQGSPWLRGALAECAWAVGRAKNGGYLKAQYRRLAHRRGKKRAIVAVGHSILVIIYHILSRQTTYQELGAAYFDERDRLAVERRAVQRLETLGYRVHLEPIKGAA